MSCDEVDYLFGLQDYRDFHRPFEENAHRRANKRISQLDASIKSLDILSSPHNVEYKKAVAKLAFKPSIKTVDQLQNISDDAAEYLDLISDIEDGYCSDLKRYEELDENSEELLAELTSAAAYSDTLLFEEQIVRYYYWRKYHNITKPDWLSMNVDFLRGAISNLERTNKSFQAYEDDAAKRTRKKNVKFYADLKFADEIDDIIAAKKDGPSGRTIPDSEACSIYHRMHKPACSVRRLQNRLPECRQLKKRMGKYRRVDFK